MGYCKFYKEKEYVSYDGGQTWNPTGVSRKGPLYQSESTDCGYVPPTPTPTCDCNVYGDIVIPAELTGIMVVGAYTSTGCSSPRTVSYVSGDADFLGDFELINSYIRAKVILANTSTVNSRTATYAITIGDCTKNLTFEQSASGTGCDCSTFSARTASYVVPATTGEVQYIVGHYTGATSCSEPITTSHRDGIDFLNIVRLNGGNVYATVKRENTGAARTATYYVRQGNCSDYFTAYQESGGTPPTPTCEVSTFAFGDTEVCNGGNLSYSYTMSSSECSATMTFSLVDSAGTVVTSKSTPYQGVGSGWFSLPTGIATGTATVTVNGSAYTVNVVDCRKMFSIRITNDTEYIIQNGNYYFYIGGEYKSINFGGGITPGSYRIVTYRVNSTEMGKTYVASKVICTITEQSTFVDVTMAFNASPTAATINDAFQGGTVTITGIKE